MRFRYTFVNKPATKQQTIAAIIKIKSITHQRSFRGAISIRRVMLHWHDLCFSNRRACLRLTTKEYDNVRPAAARNGVRDSPSLRRGRMGLSHLWEALPDAMAAGV